MVSIDQQRTRRRTKFSTRRRAAARRVKSGAAHATLLLIVPINRYLGKFTRARKRNILCICKQKRTKSREGRINYYNIIVLYY